MGSPRKVPPLFPQRGMSADDGSVGTPTRHTAGTDGARPEHAPLACRKYGLLVPTGTTVDLADVGDPGIKAGHGATGDQDEREPEEGDKSQQRVLPAIGRNGIEDNRRGNFERSRALNVCHRQGGGKTEGTPYPAARAHGAQRGTGGGPPNTAARSPTVQPGPGGEIPPPAPAAHTTRAQAGGGGGTSRRPSASTAHSLRT